MNNFIVTVEYFPKVVNKDEVFRVFTEKSKKEVESIIKIKKNRENPYFDVFVIVETADEYLHNIKMVDVNKI